MKKTIMIAALFAATAANADFDIYGKYEGNITDGSGATYSQDLDLKLVGTADGATITATLEDLAGGDTVTTNELYVETTIFDGISFKGGKSKGALGNGILQKKSAPTNKMAVSFDASGLGFAVNQASGDGNASVDVTGSFAGVDVKVQNAAEENRFVTASSNVAGLYFDVEYQKTTVGTNTGVSGSIFVPVGTLLADVTGVYVNVEDGSGVTQDDGILGDISDAAGTVKGAVVSTNSNYGIVTGKLYQKNDKTTYVGELGNGIMTYSYTKTEDTDGVAGVKIDVSF